MQHWTKLSVSKVKPSVREYHATCCIAGPLTGEQHPVLMVVGGWGYILKIIGDVWLLDVDKGVWSKVRHVEFSLCDILTMHWGQTCLPNKIKHMAIVLSIVCLCCVMYFMYMYIIIHVHYVCTCTTNAISWLSPENTIPQCSEWNS